MNKKALLACLLVMTMLLSSCALVVTDAKVDAATPIVTVGDTVYTKDQFQAYVNNYLNYMANQEYQNYGFVLNDYTSADAVASAQKAVADMLVEEAVVHQKSIELGVDKLNDEDMAEIDSTVDLYWDYLLMLGMATTPTDLTTDEELAAYKDTVLASTFGVTRESMIEEKSHDNLRAIVTKDVTVSEDEIKAAFDAKVETAKSNYAANLSAFGNDFNNGATLYYQPAGYRLVKNLLIQFNSDDQSKLSTLRSNATTQQNAANSYKTTIEANDGVNADQLLAKVTVTLTTEDDITYTAEVTDTFDATDDADQLALISNARNYAAAKALAEKYTELADAVAAEAFAAIDAKADEALAKLADGADWDEVMAEYTEDPGMQGARATAKTGYAVCEGMTGFDSAFVNAAMSLEKIGDYTQKVPSEMYGYYIIEYAGDVTEGAVDMETVRADIEAEVLESKRDEAYEAAVHSWVDGAKAVIDLAPLK